MYKARDISAVQMKLKSFKWNDRHCQNSQEKLCWNSGLNYTGDLHMCSTFEAFRLIVLAQMIVQSLCYFYRLS